MIQFIFFAQEITIDPRLVPKVGMTFSEVDEAYKFYSRYNLNQDSGRNLFLIWKSQIFWLD